MAKAKLWKDFLFHGPGFDTSVVDRLKSLDLLLGVLFTALMYIIDVTTNTWSSCRTP